MAKIVVTPKNGSEERKVFVNGIAIPDVIDVSLRVLPGDHDEAIITIATDSFRSPYLVEER